MKLSEITDIQRLRAAIIAAASNPSPAPMPPIEPIGQDGHPDVALLMRHLSLDHELDCGILDGYEVDFIGCIWGAVMYDEPFEPTAAELLVIRALNRKMQNCGDAN